MRVPGLVGRRAALIIFDRLVGPAQRLEQMPEVEEQVGVAGLERERALVRLLRSVRITGLLGDMAQLDPDREVILVAREIGAVMLHR